MSENILSNVGAVVLAAGKGTRLGATTVPKVMMHIGGKPIVSYTIATLEKAGFSSDRLCLVVGYQQQAVRDYFGSRVVYASQAEQRGTAQAAYLGVKALPPDVTEVLVMGGDDSAFYQPQTLRNFVQKHVEDKGVISVLTAEFMVPPLVGRVIRDANGNCVEVREKEQLSENEREMLKEVNTGTYCLRRSWFEKVFPMMQPIPGLGEFGLNQLVEIAVNEGKPAQAIALSDSHEWLGINTPDELKEADQRKKI